MRGQRRIFTLLGMAGLGVAVLALVIGVKGTGDLVGLVSAFASAATGVLSLAAAARVHETPSGDQTADPASDRTAPARPTGPTATQTGQTAARPAGQRVRWLLPAALAVLLLVLTGVALARWPDDRRDADATAPTASATGTPTAGPTAGPPATPEPTGAAPAPTRTGPPWLPPADAPKWTLRANDSISFRPAPKLTRGRGTGLIFQPQWEQLAWSQWTDDPKDLSYAGCRNPKAQRWDSINLRELGTDVPRTYCEPDPADPTVVNYLLIRANHFDADPPSVDVQVWSVRP